MSTEETRVRTIDAQFADEPDFARKARDEGMSVKQATISFVPWLREKLQRQADASRPARTSGPAPARPGTLPVPHGEAANGPGPDFMSQARARAKADGMRLTAAMSVIAKEDPELHKAWVESQPRMRLADALPESQAGDVQARRIRR